MFSRTRQPVHPSSLRHPLPRTCPLVSLEPNQTDTPVAKHCEARRFSPTQRSFYREYVEENEFREPVETETLREKNYQCKHC